MYKLLLFHIKNSYITTLQYYGYTYIVRLVLYSCWQNVRLIYINHLLSTLNVQTHIFLTIYVSFKSIRHQKLSTVHKRVRLK